MDERLENLRSTKNPKARIKIMKGHFATSNSHLDTYIDMSTVRFVITMRERQRKYWRRST